MLEALLGLFCISLCSSLIYGAMALTLRVNRKENARHEIYVQLTTFYFEESQMACRDSCLIEEVLSR